MYHISVVYDLRGMVEQYRGGEENGPGNRKGVSDIVTNGMFSRRPSLSLDAYNGVGSGVNRSKGRLQGWGLLTLMKGANGCLVCDLDR